MSIKISKNILYEMAVLFLTVSIWAFPDQQMIVLLSQIVFIVTSFFKCTKASFKTSSSVNYIKWATVWLTICTLSALWADYPSASVSYSKSVLQTLVIGFLLVTSLSKAKEKAFIWTETCVIIAGIVLSVRILINTPLNVLGQARIGENIGLHPNTIAISILFCQIIALTRHLEKKEKKYFFVFLLCTLMLILTASKKAVIVGLVCSVLLWVLYDKGILKKTVNILKIAITVIIALALIERVAPTIFNETIRRLNIFNEMLAGSTIDDSTAGRMELYRQAISMFYKKPVFGVGLDNFRYNVTGVMHGYYAHSNYLEIMADLGVVGLLAYYSIFYKMLKKGFAVYKKNRKYIGYLVLLCAILVLDITQVSYYMETFQWIIAYIFARIYFGNKNSMAEVY